MAAFYGSPVGFTDNPLCGLCSRRVSSFKVGPRHWDFHLRSPEDPVVLMELSHRSQLLSGEKPFREDSERDIQNTGHGLLVQDAVSARGPGK